MTAIGKPTPPPVSEPLTGAPKPELDRAKLRVEINDRYKATLQYLGR